jgi:hypothetical protein
MEDLQNAIENVQYMNAMHDEFPRPSKEWNWPSQDELKAYTDKIYSTSPESLDAERVCKGSLGFYCVSVILGIY